MQTISNAMRFFFFVIGSVIWIGIWLTPCTAHWLLYLPPIFLYFAAITGICPGLGISSVMFPEPPKAAPKRLATPKKRRKKS